MSKIEEQIQNGDWVETILFAHCIGSVKRLAKDRSWADIFWQLGENSYTKRLKTSALRIVTEIPCYMAGDCRSVEDTSRSREIGGVATSEILIRQRDQ